MRATITESKIVLSLLSGLLFAGCGDPGDLSGELAGAEEIGSKEQAITNCSFDVYMDQGKVTQGQGFTEGDLELKFQGQANSSAVQPSSPGTYTMAVGGAWRSITDLLTTVSITNSTRVISVWSGVTEVDNGGSNGTNDYGDASSTWTLDCNGANVVYKELTVNLYKNNGNGAQNGQVKVKFRAEQ